MYTAHKGEETHCCWDMLMHLYRVALAALTFMLVGILHHYNDSDGLILPELSWNFSFWNSTMCFSLHRYTYYELFLYVAL